MIILNRSSSDKRFYGLVSTNGTVINIVVLNIRLISRLFSLSKNFHLIPKTLLLYETSVIFSSTTFLEVATFYKFYITSLPPFVRYLVVKVFR